MERPPFDRVPQPHATGWLDTGDAHRVFWTASGNRDGRPVLVCHGGPGSSLSTSALSWFDRAHWLVIQFDQRGCGQSVPSASETVEALCANTTDHLVADMERLRKRLGVDRWVVAGGSRGSTLALAYARAHPQRVAGMLVYLVALTRAADVEWITRGIAPRYPAAWERFCNHLPEELRRGNLARGYSTLLRDERQSVHDAAALEWCRWEAVVAEDSEDARLCGRFADRAFRLGFARLVTHYWSRAAWLADGALIEAARAMGPVPCEIVHGQHDFGSRAGAATDLHDAWAGSRQTLVPGAGHETNAPAMRQAIMRAVDRLAKD